MGRFGRRVKLAVVILALFALSACAGNQLVVSGTMLKGMSKSFISTANLYNSLHDVGQITDAEYRAFAAFAKQFKVIYPVAVDTWKVIETNPELSEDKQTETLIDQILKLKKQLTEYYALSLDRLEVQ